MSKYSKISRCDWAGSDSLMIGYHDKEWGVPEHDDQILYEFLVLEGAQAGLSWSTILNRREGYRKAFENFNVKKVSNFSDKRIEELMTNSDIIRNRLKIMSAIKNAKAFIRIQEEFLSFDSFLWEFVNNKPIKNEFNTLKDIPSSTDLSKQISKVLKKRGFSFVGPTIIYAFMQAVGIVNDHVTTCFRYNEI